MTAYGTPTRESGAASQRERMMSLAGAALGLLMFIWGFLKWLHLEDNGAKQKYSGYAFGMPTTAVIGLSVAAGVLALLGAMERRSGRGVDSAVPFGLAVTSALLAIGLLIGKGSISPSGSFADVGVEVGLILAVITAILQALVLGAEWASRRSDAADTRGTGSYATAPAQPPPHTAAAPPQTYGQTAPPPPGYTAPPAGGTTYPPNP
ncbi:MAG TPA: DUF5336 domain-containing protein [Jatrophihabitantaceae bacterium]|nr:DUF5336 domain-containing protein [Jatrophihabitantaceae bacterium]